MNLKNLLKFRLSSLAPDLSLARDPAFTDWGFVFSFFYSCFVAVCLKLCNARVKIERKCTNDKHSKNNSTNSSHLHLSFGSMILSEIITWVKYLFFEIISVCGDWIMSPTIWLQHWHGTTSSGKMCILITNHRVLPHKHSWAFIYCYNNLGLFYVHADQEVCVPTGTLQKGCLSLYLFLLI